MFARAYMQFLNDDNNKDTYFVVVFNYVRQFYHKRNIEKDFLFYYYRLAIDD